MLCTANFKGYYLTIYASFFEKGKAAIAPNTPVCLFTYTIYVTSKNITWAAENLSKSN